MTVKSWILVLGAVVGVGTFAGLVSGCTTEPSSSSPSLAAKIEPIRKQICREVMNNQLHRYGQYMGMSGNYHVFKYKDGPIDCKIDGNVVVWRNQKSGSSVGRWRNSYDAGDTKVVVKNVSDDITTFTIRYAHYDGSGPTKTYMSNVTLVGK